MLKNFVPRTDKILQWDFCKVAVLKRFTKVAMTGFFRRATQQRFGKNETIKQFRVSADETYQ